MYAKNVATFVTHVFAGGPDKPLDLGDEIVRETLVVRDGEVVHPRLRELLGMQAAVPLG
jgi:NAD(P) transhydrogenase subunit alpha